MSVASLGSLVFELAASTAKLSSDLGRAVAIAENKSAAIAKVFKGAFAGLSFTFIAHQLIASFEAAAQFGEEIKKAAYKAGIGTAAIQELSYGAKHLGIDLDELSKGLKFMQVNLSKAGSGADEPLTALRALGLTIQELQKLEPDKQFEVIADAISKLQDPADRARAAVALFGKAGANLLPLFEGGQKAIEAFRKEAEEIGAVLSDMDIERLADAEKAIKKVDAAWDGFWRTLTAKVAPALSGVLDQLRIDLGGGTDRENQIRDLNTQIKLLEDRLQPTKAFIDLIKLNPGGAGTIFGGALGELTDFDKKMLEDSGFMKEQQKQLKYLIGLRDLLTNSAPIEGGNRPFGKGGKGTPPGFGDTGEIHHDTAGAAARAVRSVEEYDLATKLAGASQKDFNEDLKQSLINVGLLDDEEKKALESDAARQEHRNSLFAEGDALQQDLRTSQERYNDTLKHLNELLAANAIGQETYARAVAQAKDQLDGIASTIKDAFHSAFEDMLRTGKLNISELVRFIIAELTKKALFRAIDAIIDKIASIAGTGSGFAGFFGAIFGALTGHAKGASFDVGGRSGIDQNLVAFRATKGEHVDVIPAGGSRGGSQLIIYQSIDARGSTKESIERSLPRVLEDNNRKVLIQMQDILDRRYRIST